MSDTETNTETEAPPAPSPEVQAHKPKLKVTRAHSAAPVIGGDSTPVQAAASAILAEQLQTDGARTETDSGPVQGTTFLAEPREVEFYEFSGLKIRVERA